MHSILNAIGNTPIVRLNKITKGLQPEIYVKLEYYNPTGSYKDLGHDRRSSLMTTLLFAMFPETL